MGINSFTTARRRSNEPCPKCRARGADRRGDNLVRYQDGGAHCFACGHHEPSQNYLSKIEKQNVDASEPHEGPLPRDFTREVPAVAWRWLLQYGLPYSYWKDFTGYSPATERLILTHGQPVEVSVGRWIDSGNRVPGLLRPSAEAPSRGGTGQLLGGRSAEDARQNPPSENSEGEGSLLLWTGGVGGLQLRPQQPPKWRMWGDRLRTACVLEPKERHSDEVILTEDLISAHKVREAGFTTLPLFGTNLYPKSIGALKLLGRPVRLWLDGDQWGVLAPKINRLQVFLNVPVGFVRTEKDPKKYSTHDIRNILTQ